MQFIRRFHLQALFCAAAVLACALISRPFTTMGVCDDGPYILMAHTLATTGHIVYNGWGAAMMALQLYLAAAFIKLFGFSFTTVRMSTLMIAAVTAFVLQRTLVRASLSERNATIGTLALVLSPLYLMLSVTFMSDITGLFAIVLCLYGCLRALQSPTDRSCIAWLGFAVAANVLCGTSRQIAWLGTLVMVPSTLWLLRRRRYVLVAGAVATLAGALFIFACMQWLKHQLYVVPVPLFVSDFPLGHALAQLGNLLLDIPFLLLPLFALFLPEISRSRSRVAVPLSAAFFGYLIIAIITRHTRQIFSLEPTGNAGPWVGALGIAEFSALPGQPSVLLHAGVRILLTIVSLGGLIGLIASLLRPRHALPVNYLSTSLKQIIVLVVPFAIAYLLLLLASAGTTYYLFDRYALGLLVVVLPFLVCYYQEQIRPQLPLAGILLIVVMATYGTAVTHNLFSFYRARVALANELHADGVPDTSVDSGWEHNIDVELQHADHINYPWVKGPARAYIPPPPPPADHCEMLWSDKTPHIHPMYRISFGPDVCYGPAPFATVHYSRWPYSTPGTLYVVRYTPPSKP
jgi:Dolichyl-phosphate-mannose-protein mannosyltransferase